MRGTTTATGRRGVPGRIDPGWRAGLGAALVAGLAAAAGCRERGSDGSAGAPSGARLEASWTGADTATFRAPATAEWCDSLDALTILAMAGDTGIGLVIRPGAGQPFAKTGRYRVRSPGSAGHVPVADAATNAPPARPSPAGAAAPNTGPSTSASGADTSPWAAIGLRWFSKTAVLGFQADSGEVSLTRGTDGQLSGRFTAAAHAYRGVAKLSVTGTFDDLRQRPATRGCTAPTPVRPDAGEPGSSGGPDSAGGREDGVD